MARFTNKEKEQLFWAIAYITDLLHGNRKAKIEWDMMDSESCWSAFYKLRKEVQGF